MTYSTGWEEGDPNGENDFDYLRPDPVRRGARREKKQCVKCGNDVYVLRVKKENANMGRPFVACRICDYFHWEDLPKCSCGEEMITAKVKKDNQNKGRTFETCANKCFFRWIT